MEENISNTEKEEARTDKAPTAVGSKTSARAGKQNTTRTLLTQDQALEILQDVLNKCQQTGIPIRTTVIEKDGHKTAVLVFDNMDLVEGKFVPLMVQ